MTCPICTRDTDPKYRPFCSRRCADVDLAKWLTGSYAIPATDAEDIDDLEAALQDAARKADDTGDASDADSDAGSHADSDNRKGRSKPH